MVLMCLTAVATPPQTVPGIIAELGSRGTGSAVVITAGVRDDLKRAMLEAARPYCLRIQGPNCLGLMVPGLGLDAGFSHQAPLAGDVAFLSQSGALISAIVDWARGHGIGFSHIVSLGDMADADFGDLRLSRRRYQEPSHPALHGSGDACAEVSLGGTPGRAQ